MPPLEKPEEIEEVEEIEEAEVYKETGEAHPEEEEVEHTPIELIDGRTGFPPSEPAGHTDLTDSGLEDVVAGLSVPDIRSSYGEDAAEGVRKLVANYKDKIYSIFVSAKEHNLSDADVMIVFNKKEDFLSDKTGKIKSKIRKLLKDYSSESTQFWFYYKEQYEGDFKEFECGMPSEPTNADWGPLARIVQLKWQADKGQAVYGFDIPKMLKEKDRDIKDLLTPEEGYEFLIVQTRKLADGFFRDPSKARDMDYVRTKDREISKAILRTMSAYYLLFGDKKGLTSDFKDMHEQGKFIFKVKKPAHEKLSLLEKAKNFILRKKPEESNHEKLLEKALRVRYEDKTFDLDKDAGQIYQFFNKTINEFKQLINDEVDLDIQLNEGRQKRLADYYERNTAALAKKISKTKNLGTLTSFYFDGLLSYLKNKEAPKKDRILKILRPIADMYGKFGTITEPETVAILGKINSMLGMNASNAIEMKQRCEAAKEYFTKALEGANKVRSTGFQIVTPLYARAEVLKEFGKVLSFLGDKKAAEEKYTKSICDNPKDLETWRGLYEATGKRIEYMIVSESLKEKSCSALDLYTKKHKGYFEEWRKRLIEKLGDDINLTSRKLEESLTDFNDRKYPSSKDKKEWTKYGYIDEIIVLNSRKQNVYNELLGFQEQVLQLVKSCPSEYLQMLEHGYIKMKREKQDEIRDYDRSIYDVTQTYGEKLSNKDSKGRTVKSNFYKTAKQLDQVKTVEYPLAGLAGSGGGLLGGLGFAQALPTINQYLPADWQISPDAYVNAVVTGVKAVAIAMLPLLAYGLCSKEARMNFKAKVK